MTANWIVATVDATGEHFYQFSVTGINLNFPEGHMSRRFSWRVQELRSDEYDLSGAIVSPEAARLIRMAYEKRAPKEPQMKSALRKKEIARYPVKVVREYTTFGGAKKYDVTAEVIEERGLPSRTGSDAWLGEFDFVVRPGMVLVLDSFGSLRPV